MLRARQGIGVPLAHVVDGSVLMADVSGFTALSEWLAQAGEEGAEKLTGIINRFFAGVLAKAVDLGGDTLTFAGDAVLVLFEGENHAERAVTAGLRMLTATAKMPAVAVAGRATRLGMSIGVHSAPFLIVVAGIHDERLQLFALGRETEVVASAEQRANKGELAVSASTARLLGDSWALSDAGDAFWLVDCQGDSQALRRRRRTGDAGPGDGQSTDDGGATRFGDDGCRVLIPFLPPWTADALKSGRPVPMDAPEHRRACAVFVNVAGVNEILEAEGSDAVGAELQQYVFAAMSLLAKHHGYLVSSDIGSHGFKLLLSFGAPFAHEYAAANAARFAVELNQQVLSGRAGRLRHRIGINSGHVFAGEVGPDFRRQYTVMGDEVNLAARLMAAAGPGQILVSRAFAEGIGPGFALRELEAIRVKGKERPVEICELSGSTAAPARSRAAQQATAAAIFGRDAELAAIAETWERAKSGAGGALLIIGDAGVGKTTVLEHAMAPITAEAAVVSSACYEHLQAMPYTPWVEVLDQVFLTDRTDPIDQRKSRIEDWLSERLPDLGELASLLNPLLAVSFETSDVVRSLDGSARKERLHSLVGRVLAAAGRSRALAVVFEDLHWADESSLALLRGVQAWLATAPVLVLATARPAEEPVDAGPGTHVLELHELSFADAAAMVRTALLRPDLPDAVVEAVYEKTRGNPLFTAEVIRELARPGVLDRILGASSLGRAQALAALAIPDRVQGLLMSQLDRLSPGAREVAKAGSVVGRDFSQPVLRGIDDEFVGRVSLESALDELVAAELVLPDTASLSSGDSAGYRFRHALVQEVAYDSLPFARRRGLHDRVARYVEESSDDPDDGLLVHHYRNAQNQPELRWHAVKAAQRSIDSYGYLEATDYLGLARAATRGRRPDHAGLRSRVDEMLADCYGLLGRNEEAIRSYAGALCTWASPLVKAADTSGLAALPPLTRPDEREAELCRKIALASLRSWTDQKRTLRWAREAERRMPEGRPAIAAGIGVVRSVAYSRMGRHDMALATAEEALGLARESGDDALLIHALNGFATACGWLGLFGLVSEACTEAVELSQKIGDLSAEAKAQGNIGIYHELTGDFRRSLHHYELSLALYRRLGDSVGAAHKENNIANLYLTMSRPADASVYAALAREHIDESKAPGLAGCAALNLARAMIRLSDLDSAAPILAEARALLQRAESHDFLLYADLGEAELALARGDVETARTRAADVLMKSRDMGVPFEEVEALLFIGSLELDAGDLAAARSAIETSIAKASEVGSAHDRALGLVLLADLESRSEGVPRSEGVRGESSSALQTITEACELLHRCGATVDLARARRLRTKITRRTARAANVDPV